MNFNLFSISDVGKIRKKNEDSFLEMKFNGSNDQNLLLVVADGLGGHKGGDIASKIVVDIIENKVNDNNSDTYENILEQAIQEANKSIYEQASIDPNLKGMGSTCTVVLLSEGRSYVAHVGDSRAYLIRNETIKQLTLDHTVVGQMLRAGIISTEEAKISPKRNVLLRAVGIDQQLEIDIYPPIKILSDDAFLLCSDGLTEHITEQEIRDIVILHEPEEACNVLVSTANKRGGIDNITVQIVKINNVQNGKYNDVLSTISKIFNKT